MFTGIVDHCGTIKNIRREAGLTLEIECRFEDLSEGESVSVDGGCLTAVHPRPGFFECQLSEETLRLTRAPEYQVGSQVNLERSLRLSDRLGGHWVTGHIDQKGSVAALETHGEYVRLAIGEILPAHLPYLIKKGSVGINGVSLTLNQVGPSGFDVMLIPHTLERTNLRLLKVGSPVNLEFDWMVKVVLNEAKRLELLKDSR